MDQRERADDPAEGLRAALDGRQGQMWTALPGIIQSFNPVAMTCAVQPAIKGRVSNSRGVTSFVNLPLLVDCPVVFQGGGGMTLTLPIAAGDECLVIIASRCIDGWWQAGGVQAPAEARMHDLSDGFVLAGLRSVPRTLGSISTTSAQLRSDDGATVIDVAPGKITVTAAEIDLNGTLKINGAPYLAHKHSGVQTGGGNSGGVV